MRRVETQAPAAALTLRNVALAAAALSLWQPSSL